MSERREAEADGADGEAAKDVPYFIARNGSRMADDELDDESRHHGDGDGATDEGRGPAGEVLEDCRHPEVEAPETNDPEEVDEAEFQYFRICECLENGVFLDALHLGLFFIVHGREVFFFCIRQPRSLVGTVFDGKEEVESKAESRDGFEDEEFLPAEETEERVFQKDAGNRCADDRREQEGRQHERRSAGPFSCREPAWEQERIDDRIETGF